MRYHLILTASLSFQSLNTLDFDETKVLADQGLAAAQSNLGLMYTNTNVFQRMMLRLRSGAGKLLIKGMQKVTST